MNSDHKMGKLELSPGLYSDARWDVVIKILSELRHMQPHNAATGTVDRLLAELEVLCAPQPVAGKISFP